MLFYYLFVSRELSASCSHHTCILDGMESAGYFPKLQLMFITRVELPPNAIHIDVVHP